MVESGVLAADAPYELIDGELVEMSPQGPLHAILVTRIRRRLEAAYPGLHVREEKPIATDEFGLPEPDVAVVRGADTDFLERHPDGHDLRLAVEVAVTSGAVDQAKALPYARAGIAVYWLVDVRERQLLAHSDPRPTGYGLVSIVDEHGLVSPPGLDLVWTVASLLP